MITDKRIRKRHTSLVSCGYFGWQALHVMMSVSSRITPSWAYIVLDLHETAPVSQYLDRYKRDVSKTGTPPP